MKCPVCGADMRGDTVCLKCGNEAASSQDEIQVEYKDFKISEFLEIRTKPLGSVSDPQSAAAREYGKQLLPGRIKKRLPLLVSILLIVVFVAAVVYFFRLL